MSDSMRPYNRTLEGPELIKAYNEATRELAAREKRMREVAEEMLTLADHDIAQAKFIRALDVEYLGIAYQLKGLAAKLLEGLDAT